ncbi:TonB-dependent siderophore receptor [Chelatococcus sp. GCM10030263]|uniref:TonB-dependent siderophore receptor n=1 Tax=Chelatococcus sp. GCM10030263 TaxID=3273387 RepID=UPI00360F3018
MTEQDDQGEVRGEARLGEVRPGKALLRAWPAPRSQPHRPAAATLLVALAACLAANGALAQEGPAESGNTVELDPILVEGQRSDDAARGWQGGAEGPIDGYVARSSATATKTGSPIIETPASIAVVGRDQMDAQRAQSIGEATRYSPGIRSNTFGSDFRNDWFLIRGFKAEDTGYFLNGLQLFGYNYATFKLEPYGLERIDILRGPTSFLYGGSTPGGLINAVSKMPTTEPLRSVEFGINNFGNRYGAFDLGGPLAITGAEGQWFYRLTALGKVGDTQTDFTREDRIFIAPALTWTPSADTTLTILGQYQRDWTNGLNFLPYEGTVVRAPFGFISPKLFTGNPGLDTFERSQTMIGYQFEHHLNDTWTVRQNARYSTIETKYLSLFGTGYASPPTATSALLARGNFSAQPYAQLLTIDNQAQARFATGPLGHTLLFGLDYKGYRTTDKEGFGAGPNLDLLAPIDPPVAPQPPNFINSKITQTQIGAYVQDEIKFDKWTLVLTGRHDWVDTDTKNRLSPSQSADSTDSAFSGRVGLIYNSDLGLAPYFSYSRSFSPLVGINGSTQKPLVPETGEQVEVGLKYQPVGWKSFATVSLFDLKRQNVLTTDPTNILNQIQNGEVRSRGIELQAVASLTDGLNLVGAYTFYDLEITKDLNSSVIGKLPTGVPERFGSLWLDYTIQNGLFAGLGFGAGVRFVGHSFADVDNTYQVPSQTLVDAALHYQRNGWRVALNVSNLFNKTYVASCSSLSACYYGDERKGTLSVSYRW